MTDQLDDIQPEERNRIDIGPVSEGFLNIFSELQETKVFLTKYIDGITNATDKSLKFDKNLGKVKAFADKKIDHCISLLSENYKLFNDKDFLKILNDDVSALHSSVFQLHAYSPFEISTIVEKIRTFLDSFRGVEIGIIALKNANTIIESELTSKIEEVKEKVKDFESLQLALEQRETNKIYLDLYHKYDKEYDLNNRYFSFAFITSVVFTLISILVSAIIDPIDWVIFISVKILILAVGITLCTLFLRRSAHAKKLKEQAYQTHVEINAFPIHVRSLKDEDKHELIKELALKYFGKELDQNQNDKVGDLMKDQLTAGTELIKASAELVKAKG